MCSNSWQSCHSAVEDDRNEVGCDQENWKKGIPQSQKNQHVQRAGSSSRLPCHIVRVLYLLGPLQYQLP